MTGADVVHLACHGRFSRENPMFSSLLLGDGPMFVYDLERIDPPPKVVVLSACHAGVHATPTGREILGLTASLLAMGPRAVIAATVPIPDTLATVDVMARLHDRLAAGVRPADALRDARGSRSRRRWRLRQPRCPLTSAQRTSSEKIAQPVSDFTTETDVGWLSPETLELVRANVPLVYVDAVPVRVDELGRVTEIGLLLRVAADGSISRMVVSGRIMFGERVRDALLRHLEKDLGPLALPRLPADPTPFTIVEYFPDPDRSGFHDPRHHAVSLAYVVPVDGDCQPTQEALDLAWFSPAEAVSERVRAEMTGGHDRLIRLALAHVGELP